MDDGGLSADLGDKTAASVLRGASCQRQPGPHKNKNSVFCLSDGPLKETKQ